MTKTIADLIQILGSGASVKLDQTLSTADLITLAGVAKRHTAHLTIRQKLSTADMLMIAGTGTGKADRHITFDLKTD